MLMITNNGFWGYFCVFCAGFTKERTIERASSCYWTEPPLPEAFHRVSRAAGHLERQVACPQIFPVGPGPSETAEQRYQRRESSESPASGDTPEEGLCHRGPQDSWKWWVQELDSFPSETWPLKLWPLFLWKVMDMYFRGILLDLDLI